LKQLKVAKSIPFHSALLSSATVPHPLADLLPGNCQVISDILLNLEFLDGPFKFDRLGVRPSPLDDR
jgi:hypothetical protein